MRASHGFSLIELVIAVSLASFVLVGVATIASQMARNQVEGIRSGTMTGWSVVSYSAMAKEIESAHVLAYPVNNGDASDSIVFCANWSRITADRMDAAAPVSVVQYCVDSTDPDPTQARMRRYANVGMGVVCPSPGVPVACVATPAGTWTETGVVGFRLEKLPGSPFVFTRDNAIGGLQLKYVIGQQAPTTNTPNPKFMVFDFGVAMQKQYNNTLD